MDCGSCDKCGYPNADWFPIGVIRFCRKQMVFLLESIDDLRLGVYPRPPEASSYVDPSIRIQPRQQAPYEKIVELASEVDSRLKMCGREGKLLELEIAYKKRTPEEMAQCRECGFDYCPALKALNYISGWRRRETKYTQWKSLNKKAKNEHQMPYRET